MYHPASLDKEERKIMMISNNNSSRTSRPHRPRYQKEQKICTTDAKHPLSPLVDPSEKYAKTMELIKAKGFFVDAQYGNRIRFTQIEEFHVDNKDGRDVPVLVCNIQYKNKAGDTVRRRSVYRIVRYNDKEIIGMNSRNMNVYVLNRVKVDTSLPPEKSVPVQTKKVYTSKYHS
jgi:predicted transcriptional regulator YheO